MGRQDTEWAGWGGGLISAKPLFLGRLRNFQQLLLGIDEVSQCKGKKLRLCILSSPFLFKHHKILTRGISLSNDFVAVQGSIALFQVQ